jgi:dsDNA-specific endonuclease/ATPase MutS2
MIAGIIFGGWFTLGLIVTGLLIRNTIKFSIEINRIADNINTYGSLLDLIEKQKFSSEILENIQKNIRQDNNQASAMFKSFSKKVDLFNNRNNFLVGIFGNALLLWDSQTIFALEKWITNNKETVSNWISGIFEMDALLSLSLYRFNHPHFRFPTLLSQEDKTLLKAEEIGHPLLNVENCITNSVTMTEGNFLIITGANMAGKSTFLRTIGLTFVMTNVGLPIFAKNIEMKPQKLISSMRTEDSLKDDESYFYNH